MPSKPDFPTDTKQLANCSGKQAPSDRQKIPTPDSGASTRVNKATPKESNLPSERQIDYAKNIHKKLADTISARELELALSSRSNCGRFIDKHKKAFEARLESEDRKREKAAQNRFLKELNKLDCITPKLRTALSSAETPSARLAALNAYKVADGGFTRIDPNSLSSIPEKLIGYWLEGLLSTAFDNMGKLDDLIGDPKSTFTVDEIEELLSTQPCRDLKFDQPQPPVRHLVLKLEDERPQKKDALVLSALPLMAVRDPDDIKGYRWTPATERIPLFNRHQLGESEKRWPGLMLDHVSAYDAWALGQQEELQQADGEESEATNNLSEALRIWDDAFDILFGSDQLHLGLKGWIDHFMSTRKEFWQVKNRRPVFALVDNGAVGGASIHVCNAYRQLLLEPEWLTTKALALFRRIADTEPLHPKIYEPEQHGHDSGHITSYFGHMDSFKDGKREAFPLDPAQRDALIALELTSSGELLAVNGPPGTGKTSLLRGVIASHWISPLLGSDTEPDCPLILACAATNQAVTNIISSFDETPGPSLFNGDNNLLEGTPIGADSRWLPQLVSYGWYVPPRLTPEVLRDYGRFQLVEREASHAPWKFNGVVEQFNGLSDTQLEDSYLRCAEYHFGIRLDLASVLQRLRQKVGADKGNIEALQNQLGNWIKRLLDLQAREPWTDMHQSRRQQLMVRAETLGGASSNRQQLLAEVSDFDANLNKLARFNDFSMPTQQYVGLLATLSANDSLRTETDYDSVKQQYEDVSALASALEQTRHHTFLQRLKDAFSSVLHREEHKRRWEALREAMFACGLPVSDGEPDIDVWSNAIAERKITLRRRLDAVAAEAIRIYLTKLGVALTPTDDYREVWPNELVSYRETLRTKRANLVAAISDIDEELAQIGQEIAGLTQIRDIFAKASVNAKNARAAVVSDLNKFGDGLPKNTELLEAMDKSLETTLKGIQTEAGILHHQFEANRHAQDWLDIHIRTRLFHLGARYWEGRYIQLRKRAAARLKSDETYAMSSAEQLRHLAMLAPVFVVTAYSAPKLMRRNLDRLDDNLPPYLFGEADLLIVDEAGQGTPEIGASAFMFAHKSIVVGDVAQLEPVWSMEEMADKCLVSRFRIGPKPTQEGQTPYQSLVSSGVLLARGSVMRIAQRATNLTNPAFPKMPGLTLTNHYRCLTPIIEICNRMVYNGALRVATRPPRKLWRPELARLGFLVIDEVANTKNPSGSRRNLKEAECIAQWLHENEASLVRHFSKKEAAPIEDLIAIVTPFKGQIYTLKKAIADQYEVKFDENDKSAIYNKMTIDTVHSLQGAEKPIVIFAMVDTNDPAGPQFYDKGSNLINVAISRAKEMFIVAMTQKAVAYARSLTEETLNKPSDYLWQAVVAHGSRLNSRRFIVVESPNKCEAIRKAFGSSIELEVLATEGHIAELEKPLQWNALSDPKPTWSSISDTALKMFERITILWPDLETFYLATDPDPEGEAIAWHILRILQERRGRGDISETEAKTPKLKRMRFYNLEPEEITRAYDAASDGIDGGLVKSALARTLLDYLITTQYPACIGIGNVNEFTRGIGRVQLGILDLVNRASQQEPRYAVKVTIPLADGSSLTTFAASPNKAMSRDAKRMWQTPREELAKKAVSRVLAKLQQSQPKVSILWKRDSMQQHQPYPGLNTARLLALAWRSKSIQPARAMAALQALYEGATELPSPPPSPKSPDKAPARTEQPLSLET